MFLSLQQAINVTVLYSTIENAARAGLIKALRSESSSLKVIHEYPGGNI